jgi:RIO kinase 1
LYEELVLVMRTMFHQCKLVHADLSEYNILYHEGHLWIIDVSQSVEHDHPAAFDFLRNDIKNVEEFFGRLGVRCLGLRRCFEFITFGGDADGTLLKTWLADELETSSDRDAFRGDGSQYEDSVFLQSFIPRTLNEVFDPERDVAKLKRGEGDRLIYAKTIGLMTPSDVLKDGLGGEDGQSISGVIECDNNDPDEQDHISHSSQDDDDVEGESESTEEGFIERKPRGHRHEDRDAKKVW